MVATIISVRFARSWAQLAQPNLLKYLLFAHTLPSINSLSTVSRVLAFIVHPGVHRSALSRVSEHEHAINEEIGGRDVRTVARNLPAGDDDMAVKSLVCFSYPGIWHGGQQGLCSESDTLLQLYVTHEAAEDAIERQANGAHLERRF
jgi:hypothetical protein